MIKFVKKAFSERKLKVPSLPTFAPKNVLSILLTVGGLGLVSFGVGLIYPPLGFIAGGVSLLLLERGLADE